MKLLYATSNNSKIYNMKRRIKDLPIELLTPRDLDLKLSILEDGTTPTENAIKKAQAYYEKTGIPTIATDSGLYITKLPENEQPGLFVRRVNGKELTDNEMIVHYQTLMNKIGGSSEAYYITGIALITDSGLITIQIQEDSFILTSKRDDVHEGRGNPLDVITIEPTNNKYYSEMTDEEIKGLGYKFDSELINFLEENFIQIILKN